MKRTLYFISVLLIMLIAFSVSISANRTLPLVVDNADLLSEYDEASLTEKLEQISDSLLIEIAVVTVNSTDGVYIMNYADDFYDYNGYGYGANDDGVMLVIDMGNREWWITTHGLGQLHLSDYALAEIEDDFIDYLSDGDYYYAFSTFADSCKYYIEASINGEDTYESGGFSLSYLFPSLIVGFIVALVWVSSMKSKMKTVRSAVNAANYTVDGSLTLRSSQDHYLYSNTVRTRRDTDSGSSGGSTHRSSSGRSHGGRGGRF